jgi:hypothetical protein
MEALLNFLKSLHLTKDQILKLCEITNADYCELDEDNGLAVYEMKLPWLEYHFDENNQVKDII